MSDQIYTMETIYRTRRGRYFKIVVQDLPGGFAILKYRMNALKAQHLIGKQVVTPQNEQYDEYRIKFGLAFKEIEELCGSATSKPTVKPPEV